MKEKTEVVKFYVTTFCNRAHNVKTGRPIMHKCYTLNPKALAQEVAGVEVTEPIRHHRRGEF